MPKHAHRLIVETAEKMAAEVFDHLMHRNRFYEAYQASHPNIPKAKLQAHFIKTQRGKYLNSARTILAQMLGTNIDESLKEQIYDALIRDNHVKRIKAPSRARN